MSNPETTENIPGKWGLLAKYDDPIIRFLVDRKFPWLKRISNAPPPPLTVGRNNPPVLGRVRETVSDGKLTALGQSEVDLYVSKLQALSGPERRALFDQEQVKA